MSFSVIHRNCIKVVFRLCFFLFSFWCFDLLSIKTQFYLKTISAFLRILILKWSKSNTECMSFEKVKQLAPSKQIDLNDRHDTLRHLSCIFIQLLSWKRVFILLFVRLPWFSQYLILYDQFKRFGTSIWRKITYFRLVAKWNLID